MKRKTSKMEVALFLGKFQPPHVGHLLTISKLASEYGALKVGITQSPPSVMTQDEVENIFKRLLPNPNITYHQIQGSIEAGTAILEIECDVYCSGNPQVLDILSKQGKAVRYVERAADNIYTGTAIRDAYLQRAADESKREVPLFRFEVIKTDTLRPIEKINTAHFAALERDILSSGKMRAPLIVDSVSGAVLDGSHRYAFLIKHGCHLAPAYLCDYDDEAIFVGNHLQHRFAHDQLKWINKKNVRSVAFSGHLYPPRTTRHFFPFRKVERPVNLEDLKPGDRCNIDHLLASTSPEAQIEMNENYIKEIEAEISHMRVYIKEQEDVKAWLQFQNTQIGGL